MPKNIPIQLVNKIFDSSDYVLYKNFLNQTENRQLRKKCRLRYKHYILHFSYT